MGTFNDYPIEECEKTALPLLARGARIHQKFTCCGCGKRNTVEVPDRFFRSGICDCGAQTDLVIQGCDYLVMIRLG